MSKLPEYEEEVTCPFDKSHRIRRYKYVVHFHKCRRSHMDVKIFVCDFNPTHVFVNKNEYDHHLAKCPEYNSLCRSLTSVIPLGHEQAPAQPSTSSLVNEKNGSVESWDDDNTPAYNPQEYVEKAPILRKIALATPKERKAFRNKERKRLNNLES